MSAALAWMLALGLCLGLALGIAARRLPRAEGDLAERIDALLPQTQCGQCGHIGCLPYARALADGSARIDQCPPGGRRLIEDLALLLGIDATTLNQTYRDESLTSPRIAAIDESRCIGCALCLPACPVDAIVGAPRFMHTVLRAECTGCELCLPVCPVDCIDLVPARAAPASLAGGETRVETSVAAA